MSTEFISANNKKGEFLIRVTLWSSIIINVFLVFSSIFIGFQTKIQSLILDGIHSFTDLFSDMLLLFIFPFVYKDRDYNHTYGHARYEDILSLLIGILIIGAALPFLNNAYQSIILHKDVDQLIVNQWAWLITISTVILKEFLYHLTMFVGKKVNSNMLIANGIHHRSDVCSSLLVLCSLIGVSLGYHQMDHYISFLLGLYLMYSGIKIIWSSMHVLTDRAPVYELKIIEQVLQTTEEVYGFHDLRLRQSGPFIMGDVHLELDGYLTIIEAHIILKAVQVSIREKLPNLLYFTIHIDHYNR
ncbi:MAG: cation diffusion facilitator family transporter [Brevinema sp.]